MRAGHLPLLNAHRHFREPRPLSRPERVEVVRLGNGLQLLQLGARATVEEHQFRLPFGSVQEAASVGRSGIGGHHLFIRLSGGVRHLRENADVSRLID